MVPSGKVKDLKEGHYSFVQRNTMNRLKKGPPLEKEEGLTAVLLNILIKYMIILLAHLGRRSSR